MIQDVDEIWSTLSHPDADHNAMYAKTVGIKLFTTQAVIDQEICEDYKKDKDL